MVKSLKKGVSSVEGLWFTVIHPCPLCTSTLTWELVLFTKLRTLSYINTSHVLHYNWCRVEVLKSTFLFLDLTLDYLSLVPHTLQYLQYLHQQRNLEDSYHSNHHRSFVSPTWMHLQIISNTRPILHKYNIYIFHNLIGHQIRGFSYALMPS